MTGRCHYCGCLLTYRASPSKESLATAEQRRAVIAAARDSGDWRSVGERLRGYGHREVWGIAFRCPGCGRSGASFRPEYRRDEAETISAAQNRRAESPAALEQVAGWRQEVRRRAEREARYLADLLRSQLPEWVSFLQFVRPNETSPAGGDDLEWDCALVARIPSLNLTLEAPLEVRVLCGEVRPAWGRFWHTHVERGWDSDGEDLEHVQRAADLLVSIATEQQVFVVTYRNGNPTSSGTVPRGAALPAWVSSAQDRTERITLRSWRGTYDRDLLPDALSP